MPKVSIIIPIYNVAPYLRQCLDSVVNQTLRDIEIICVDDGSTDGSAAILAEYTAKDPRVKVLTREHTNAGASRNAGMAVATGEYLVSQLKNLRFGLDVEIAQADVVSYWIRHADCCVTDYSSVSFDFVFLHKPTIYWIPDRNDPILEATDREEQQFARRQTGGFYNSVDSADNVVDMIEYYADRDFVLEPEKCAIGDTFFAYKTGICGRLHEELEKIAAAEASIQT